jgi:membrane associated rhomboid family serine protease
MNWLNKLERKFGRFAIPGLINFIVILTAMVFFLTLIDKSGRLVNILTLDPTLVMKGEIWRLITYIFIPPLTSPIFMVFALYLFYIYGTGLEEEWGSFKFNLYYLIGMIATTIAAFISGGGKTGVYLDSSIFLAFAYIYPDYELRIFFILPVKVKYLAWLNWAFIVFTILKSQLLSDKIVAIVSVANYFLFFGKDLFQRAKQKKQVYNNRHRFIDESTYSSPVHVCEYCGMTEKTDSNMEFHHCPDCDPKYEYCTKHIGIHKHVKQSL